MATTSFHESNWLDLHRRDRDDPGLGPDLLDGGPESRRVADDGATYPPGDATCDSPGHLDGGSGDGTCHVTPCSPTGRPRRVHRGASRSSRGLAGSGVHPPQSQACQRDGRLGGSSRRDPPGSRCLLRRLEGDSHASATARPGHGGMSCRRHDDRHRFPCRPHRAVHLRCLGVGSLGTIPSPHRGGSCGGRSGDVGRPRHLCTRPATSGHVGLPCSSSCRFGRMECGLRLLDVPVSRRGIRSGLPVVFHRGQVHCGSGGRHHRHSVRECPQFCPLSLRRGAHGVGHPDVPGAVCVCRPGVGQCLA